MNETTLIRFDVTDEAIRQLGLQFKDAEAETKNGYDHVKAGIATVGKLRSQVEKTRKALKHDALDYGRKVDGEAKRITAALREVEDPLKKKKQAVDDAKQAEIDKAAEEHAAARKAEDEKRIHDIAEQRKKLDKERAEVKREREEFEAQKKAAQAFQEPEVGDEKLTAKDTDRVLDEACGIAPGEDTRHPMARPRVQLVTHAAVPLYIGHDAVTIQVDDNQPVPIKAIEHAFALLVEAEKASFFPPILGAKLLAVLALADRIPEATDDR